MIKNILILLLFFIWNFSFGQNLLAELLNKYNTKDIPYITVHDLKTTDKTVVILDARELKEYQISHIKNAMHIGYEHFKLKTVENLIPNKNKQIVVYCSPGIRSETIAHKLQKAGYKNITNLYGGIFEWKNKDYLVYNSEENQTDEVHTF